MKLIAGLGNPGTEYAFTRHNTGWLCVDHIIVNKNLGSPQTKFHSEFWKSDGVIYIKPLTFMNSSGIAVSEAVNFYKIELSDVLIIYDDMALPFGKLRLRANGSAGGHNGLISILGALGSLDVPRLRVGIGKAPGEMINYVLGHFNEDERKQLPDIVDNVERAVNTWLDKDIQRAMTLVNASRN
ncbi:MAG: aminoacyl-tRNA hydrolase [Synergistaceae bacterium]|nr:aminoacyl-tRNA hydrolase [Synergistaceae bacterium]